jgi:hypothetical protein
MIRRRFSYKADVDWENVGVNGEDLLDMAIEIQNRLAQMKEYVEPIQQFDRPIARRFEEGRDSAYLGIESVVNSLNKMINGLAMASTVQRGGKSKVIRRRR